MTLTQNAAWSPFLGSATGGHIHPQIIETSTGNYLAIHTVQQGHSGYAYTVARTSTDLTTWSAPITVARDLTSTYSLAFHNVVRVSASTIVVWLYKRLAAAPHTANDNGYVISTDGGATWGSYVSRGGLIDGQVCSMTPAVEVNGSLYFGAWGYWKQRVYKTTDGYTIDASYTAVPDATSDADWLNENALAYQDGMFVLAVRTEDAGATRTTHGIKITYSTDDCETWSTLTNIGPSDKWFSHPTLFSMNGKLWLMAGDREGTNYATQKLWAWSTTPARLLVDVTDWTAEGSFARPVQATYTDTFYGYPHVFPIDTDTAIVHVVAQPVAGVVGFEYEHYAVFSGFTPEQGRIISVSGTDWSLDGTTITCSSAPIGERTTATLSVYSSLGGDLRITSDTTDSFELSTDGLFYYSEVYVDAGTSTVYIGVTPESGDGTVTCSLEVPV